MQPEKDLSGRPVRLAPPSARIAIAIADNGFIPVAPGIH